VEESLECFVAALIAPKLIEIAPKLIEP